MPQSGANYLLRDGYSAFQLGADLRDLSRASAAWLVSAGQAEPILPVLSGAVARLRLHGSPWIRICAESIETQVVTGFDFRNEDLRECVREFHETLWTEGHTNWALFYSLVPAFQDTWAISEQSSRFCPVEYLPQFVLGTAKSELFIPDHNLSWRWSKDDSPDISRWPTEEGQLWLDRTNECLTKLNLHPLSLTAGDLWKGLDFDSVLRLASILESAIELSAEAPNCTRQGRWEWIDERTLRFEDQHIVSFQPLPLRVFWYLLHPLARKSREDIIKACHGGHPGNQVSQCFGRIRDSLAELAAALDVDLALIEPQRGGEWQVHPRLRADKLTGVSDDGSSRRGPVELTPAEASRSASHSGLPLRSTTSRHHRGTTKSPRSNP